jgi:hypothetical protein
VKPVIEWQVFLCLRHFYCSENALKFRKHHAGETKVNNYKKHAYENFPNNCCIRYAFDAYFSGTGQY